MPTRMELNMTNNYSDEYVRKIHTVQDYIETHISEPLNIETLADVAGFSVYHFSRIFQSISGESLAAFYNRIRMEHALFMLAHCEDENMTGIALDLGFTDSSVFSRAFKNHYGISPREYRKNYNQNDTPIVLSDYNKPTKTPYEYWESIPVKGDITVRNIEPFQALYVRFTGSYKELAKKYPNMIQTLLSGAASQGIIPDKDTMVFAIYHDNPEFTFEDKFRTSLCIAVPEGIKVHENGHLGVMNLEGGKYAIGHFTLSPSQYKDAWNYMYLTWTLKQNITPRNCSPFEVYQNIPDDGGLHQIEIYLPIQ